MILFLSQAEQPLAGRASSEPLVVSTEPIVVSTAAALLATLHSAQGGETILLAAGDYGDVKVDDVVLASTVHIASRDVFDAATFHSLTIDDSSNLAFASIYVKAIPDATTLAFSSAILITDSSSISISSSNIRGGLAVNGVDPSANDTDATGNVLGLPAGRGVTVSDSTDIAFINNDIHTFHKGIVLDEVNGVTISGNEIHDLRTSPITGSVVDNVLIEQNYLHDSTPWNFGGTGDHGDFIHFWTTPAKQSVASQNIVIRDNTMNQGSGTALLGIYLDDNNNGIGFGNVVIEGNTIINNNAQAIRLETVQAVVSGNTLVQAFATDYHDFPGVTAIRGSTLSLTDNIVSRITVDAASTITESGNLATINGVLDLENRLLTPVTSAMKVFAPFDTASAVLQSSEQISNFFLTARDGGATGNQLYVVGTAGVDNISLKQGNVRLDPSFNRGGDVIHIAGEASDFSAVRQGSTVLLEGADLNVLLPVGLVGTTIEFSGGDKRELVYDPAAHGFLLGDQPIGFNAVGLTDFA